MDFKVKGFEDTTPGKATKDLVDNIHNSYHDLKNIWSENAKDKENEKQMFVLTVLSVFVFGFLFSQISEFILYTPSTEYVPESLPPLNLTQILNDAEYSVNYASAFNGARVLEEFSMVEYLGWFSYFSTNRRDSLINDNNSPGVCWPFQGDYGFVAVKLSQVIQPNAFTLVHLNSIDFFNAPRRFNVFSLDGIDECVMLGTYEFEFDVRGEKRKDWQRFDCQFNCEISVGEILLEVFENYGSDKTCVYQFMVHGVLDN